MGNKREQATIKEIIEVISEIILKTSIRKFDSRDVGYNDKTSSSIYESINN
jgi:hypothetical protein